MPRAGPSRLQRQPLQTQTQHYSRSQRRFEDKDKDEEIAIPNSEDDEEPCMDDTNSVCDALVSCAPGHF